MVPMVPAGPSVNRKNKIGDAKGSTKSASGSALHRPNVRALNTTTPSNRNPTKLAAPATIRAWPFCPSPRTPRRRGPKPCVPAARRGRSPRASPPHPLVGRGTPAPFGARTLPESLSGTRQGALCRHARRCQNDAHSQTSRLLGQRPRMPYELLCRSRAHEARQALGLSPCHPSPETRYAVVATALVVHPGVGTLVRLLYEAIGQHPFDRTVQGPRP